MVNKDEILTILKEWKKDSEDEINVMGLKIQNFKNELEQLNVIEEQEKYNEIVDLENELGLNREMLKKRLIKLNEMIDFENSFI